MKRYATRLGRGLPPLHGPDKFYWGIREVVVRVHGFRRVWGLGFLVSGVDAVKSKEARMHLTKEAR